jgi:hypothetical protein
MSLRREQCGVFAPCKNCWTTETLKHAPSNRITSFHSSLPGNSQRANELTQWEPREMFSVRSVLTNSVIGFSVRSASRLCNPTLVIFGVNSKLRGVPDEAVSSRWEVNAVTVLIQWQVNNSRGRNTRTRQKTGTRSTEENKWSACEELTCDYKTWFTRNIWSMRLL